MKKPTQAIEFSGGTESLLIMKMFEHTPLFERPLLLCFIHKGMESFVPLFREYAKLKGFKIKFIIDMEKMVFESTFGLRCDKRISAKLKKLFGVYKERIVTYNDDLVSPALKLNIKRLYSGRRRQDLMDLPEPSKIAHPQIKVPMLNACLKDNYPTNIEVRFPLWNKMKK